MSNTLTIDDIKQKATPVLRDAGVKRSAIFGSYARGENTEYSDIDLLVDMPLGKSLLDLADLQDKLEHTLNHHVDLVTYNSIHPLFKENILQSHTPIYE